MSGLRAGGLAMIIGLRVHTHDNGKMVSLVELVEPGGCFKDPVKDSLTTNSTSKSLWLVTGNLKPAGSGGKELGDAGWALIAPANLMPIDPDEITEEEQDREAVQ